MPQVVNGRREYHVLNLGAGTQSTLMYLMSCTKAPKAKGLSLSLRLANDPPALPQPLVFDAAVMGDTQAEPKQVYRHLQWLRKLNGPTIFVESKGSLEHDLLHGTNSDGSGKSNGDRFASIPYYTAPPPEMRSENFKEGQAKRQCTREYKSDVVIQVIRRRIIGLKPRQHFPKNVHVFQYFGFTSDEMGRMKRLQDRFKESQPWATPRFPLIEWGWSRKDCIKWLESRVPHTVIKSACVFCPYRDNASWKDLRDNHPEDWARAVSVDYALRENGVRCAEGLDQLLYLHRSCLPLDTIDFDAQPPQQLDLFSLLECEGMCGN